MNEHSAQVLGTTIQVICVGLGFYLGYLAITWHPVFLLLTPIPYILVYNILYRGIIADSEFDDD